jgi:hypothetical protein
MDALLSDRRERLITSGLGTEMAIKLLDRGRP